MRFPRRHQVLVDEADEEDVGLDELGKGLFKAAEGGLRVGHAPV